MTIDKDVVLDIIDSLPDETIDGSDTGEEEVNDESTTVNIEIINVPQADETPEIDPQNLRQELTLDDVERLVNAMLDAKKVETPAVDITPDIPDDIPDEEVEDEQPTTKRHKFNKWYFG